MLRRPPRFTRTDTLVPYTTLFRSRLACLPDGGFRPAAGQKLDRAAIASALMPVMTRLPAQTDVKIKPQDIVAPIGRAFVPRISGIRYGVRRSEEHTSELQSLMRTSYAVFCLKKNKTKKNREH